MASSAHHNQQNGNFWAGFSAGMVFAGVSLFVMGTKQGRHIARKVLESVDDLDGVIDELVAELNTEGDKHHLKKTSDSAEEAPQKIHDVLDKIMSVLPTRRQVKQYFVKDGKILK